MFSAMYLNFEWLAFLMPDIITFDNKYTGIWKWNIEWFKNES